ncbi:ERF family protein, partial [Desulfovibrio sp. ZJ369]|uniref:ERF family protein n=1 Tax=Desulfovibrio sp. ZJ369 TaxID=2709793 RepID=UPI0013E9D68E
MDYAFSSPEITELSKALIEVQKHLQPAIKDAENPFARNRYATLNSVMDSCRMALLDNGILLTQYPVPVEGSNLGLVTKLVHAKTGQFQASLAVIPLAKPDPQAMGSAFTYGRRYALSAMLGIVSEEDDDGNAASGRNSQGRVRGIKATGSQSGSTMSKRTAPVDRGPLSQLLADLGLSELMPCYR